MPNRLPAEWEPHEKLWIGFPHDATEWPGQLEAAQREVAGFANAVAASGEAVSLICRNASNLALAQSLVDPVVQCSPAEYGDIWLRDTGPLVTRAPDGSRRAQIFRFNGWGGKYRIAGDETIGVDLAKDAGLPTNHHGWILEGGAIDVDGRGLGVTTEQCLLNPNRNPQMRREDIEDALRAALGIERLLWLGDGLINDHTDGHVDNLARFVAPGVLAVPEASGGDDPNADIYADAADRAAAFGLETIRLPSPGRVESEGIVQPASHMNFVVGNRAVFVPVYGTPYDQAIVDALQAIWPDKSILPLPASAILSGGGSLHCASQPLFA
ncbi:agmatine deiminase family protein [Alterisphingorhabdus coralli]|uniref:Agmatine deiminase family protein n=1 Tax=Alterisphingorhabdus coralli TaxID=3071408 RepID=A0AA97I1H3_9SPHN|nr:agmatine deiminase family protein [Parasphingorhabdus sp. SCSIO 66989]WOE76037.1 agmatine deiminase family protein [Parasphingorhabdus sp. SCSIO 66989]